MGENDKFKALFTGVDHSLEKEWSKVALNDEIFEEVLAKYGSYKNIGKEMTDDILEWLRKKA